MAPNRGFTLVEVLLSAAILCIVTVAASQAVIQGASMCELARQTSISGIELSRMVARLESTPFAALDDNFPDGEVVNLTPTNIGDPQLPNEVMTVDYQNTASDPLTITVSVSWLSRGRQLTRSITLLRGSAAN